MPLLCMKVVAMEVLRTEPDFGLKSLLKDIMIYLEVLTMKWSANLNEQLWKKGPNSVTGQVANLRGHEHYQYHY